MLVKLEVKVSLQSSVLVLFSVSKAVFLWRRISKTAKVQSNRALKSLNEKRWFYVFCFLCMPLVMTLDPLGILIFEVFLSD